MTILLSFVHCEFVQLPLEENQMADALATLASVWESGELIMIKPLILVRSQTLCYEEVRVMSVQVDEKPWFYDLQRYLETGQFFEDVKKKERVSLRRLSR